MLFVVIHALMVLIIQPGDVLSSPFFSGKNTEHGYSYTSDKSGQSVGDNGQWQAVTLDVHCSESGDTGELQDAAGRVNE